MRRSEATAGLELGIARNHTARLRRKGRSPLSHCTPHFFFPPCMHAHRFFVFSSPLALPRPASLLRRQALSVLSLPPCSHPLPSSCATSPPTILLHPLSFPSCAFLGRLTGREDGGRIDPHTHTIIPFVPMIPALSSRSLDSNSLTITTDRAEMLTIANESYCGDVYAES